MIATANGLLSLSIPIAGGRNQAGLYRDIAIDHKTRWQQQHWRSIFSAYGKSPWFFQYADGLEDLFTKRDRFLVDWNFRCLNWLGGVLKWKQGPWTDPGPAGGREVPVREANNVHPGGLDLPMGEARADYPAWWLQEPRSGLADLDLADRILPGNYQDPGWALGSPYPQVFADRYGYQPGLSILDLLFCLGPQSRQWLDQSPLPGRI